MELTKITGRAMYTMMLCDAIQASWINLFDFDYPFYLKDRKEEFQNAFIRHFLYREIGFETIDEFAHNLRVVFTEKIEFYNKLMELAEAEYNPLLNYDLTEVMDRKGSELTTGETSAEDTFHSTNKDNFTENEDTTSSGTSKDVSNNTITGTKSGSGSIDHSVFETNDTNRTEQLELKKTGTDTDTGSSTVDLVSTTKDKGSITEDNNLSGSANENKEAYHSDLPQGSLQNIKALSYATTADIESNNSTNNSTEDKELTRNLTLDKTDNTQTSNTLSKSINETDKHNNTIIDDIQKEVTEGTDTTDEESTNSTETGDLSGTVSNTNNIDRSSNRTIQKDDYDIKKGNSETDKKTKDDYTLTRKGNVGVQTSAQILEYEIELRKKLTNIWNMFFEEECDILFMQVF